MLGDTPARVQDMVLCEANRLAVPVSAAAAQRVAAFLGLVDRWGQRLNLTGRPEAPSLVTRQLADGLVLADCCRALAPPPSRALEVGAGAGLVGLPLAILCPDLSLGLLEASRRKCAFLRTAVHALGLSAEVHQGRFEELALPPQALVFSRATWAPATWAQLGLRVLEPGGHLVCFLAREAVPELPALRLAVLREYQLQDGSPRRLALLRLG